MEIRLFFAGDYVNKSAKRDFVDNKLSSIISAVDLAVCNLEAPIVAPEMSPIKKAGPHISQTEESLSFLAQNGFHFVSLANNHIYDYGQSGLLRSIEALRSYDINFVGAGENFDQAYSSKIIQVKDMKFGFLAACENEFGCLDEPKEHGGYAWINHYLIEDKIRKLKKEVDIVIFMAHTGVENVNLPLREWRDRYRRLCDEGVDVIIGHHPHIPQGIEHYKGSLIFYSLGNFFFDTAGFQKKSDDSFSVILTFENKKNQGYEIIYHQKESGQTTFASKEDVNFSLETLNADLNSEYEKKSDEMCLNLYRDYYKRYYKDSLGVLAFNDSFLLYLKFLIKKIFGRRPNTMQGNLLLLHNIKIDSHRFVVQRALSQLCKEESI